MKQTGKILILGGGFGGIRAALDLDKKFKGQADITLMDKNAHHLFVPALYEVASAYWSMPEDPYQVTLRGTVAIPYRDIFLGKNINFIQAEVSSVDLASQLVATKGDNVFSYDYLVLALGSQAADFGIPGVRDYAFQFRMLDDAVMINRHIRSFFGKISKSGSGLPMKVLICGAGFTGIELAAELSVFIRKLARKTKLSSRPAMIYMFEAMPKLLPNVSDGQRQRIRDRLTELGVIVMENSVIEEVGERMVKLKNGQTMDGDMVIWTAGLQANRLLQSIEGLELTPRGKIVVGEHLHLKNARNVFAVGDNIEFMDHKTQKPIPALAYLAIDHGAVAARNIYNSVHDRELMVHKPSFDAWVAPVGDKHAVAHVKGIVLSGFAGWVLHELITLRYLLTILPFKKALSFFWKQTSVFTKND